MPTLLRRLLHWFLFLLPPARQQAWLAHLRQTWQQCQPLLLALQPTRGAPVTPRWRSADVVDLHHYLAADDTLPAAERDALTQHERRLYLEHIAPQLSAAEHSVAHRRATLYHWLTARRAAEPESTRHLSPGHTLDRSQRLFTVGLALIGLVLGGSLASVLLHYDGHTPVSVTWYLFWLVFLQLLLVTGTGIAWYSRRTQSVQQVLADVSIVTRLLQPPFERLASWLHTQRLAHVTAAGRDQLQTYHGQLRAQVALHGPAAYLPLLIPIQSFGIGFNVGAILITILTEWFSDLAFGWGTALNIDPHTVYQLTRTVALPWGWLLGEGVGYPSLDAIEGTRILLKNPLAWSNDEYLRAWRWFLVLAVISYGLLPRLVLLWVSLRTQAHTLAALPFTHHHSQALYARLLAPQLTVTPAASGIGPAMPIPAVMQPPPVAELTPVLLNETPALANEKPALPAIAANACLVLIPMDLAELITPAAHPQLQQLLLPLTGWEIAATVTFSGRQAAIEQALATIGNYHWAEPPGRVVILTDGAQPPITEYLVFVQRVRTLMGKHAPVLIALTGEPDDDAVLVPVRPMDFTDWKRKIDQLGDPYLRLAALISTPVTPELH